MRRPPPGVRLVARTHWLVGGTAALTVALVYGWTHRLPVTFSHGAYYITGGFAVLYLLTGTLVWFGAPPGRVCSRICGLLYLVRARRGAYLWDMMNSEEYQAHFGGDKDRRDRG